MNSRWHGSATSKEWTKREWPEKWQDVRSIKTRGKETPTKICQEKFRKAAEKRRENCYLTEESNKSKHEETRKTM